MDALSALKTVAGSQVGFQSLDPAQEGGAAKAISLSDLQKFGPGITYQSPASLPSTISVPDLDKAGSTTSSEALTPGSSGGSFQNMLGGFVNEVSAQQAAGTDAVNGLLSGKNVSLHQAMISMEEANVSFQMMVEVRNKLLDSYQELMRMSV